MVLCCVLLYGVKECYEVLCCMVFLSAIWLYGVLLGVVVLYGVVGFCVVLYKCTMLFSVIW